MGVHGWRERLGTRGRFPGQPRDWISPRRKRFWVLVSLAVYTLVGIFLAPWVTQRLVVAELGELLERPVTLERVRINPFVLSLEANDFAVREQDGRPLIGFERLFVNFQLSSLFRWAWTFREITLEGPSAAVRRDAEGQINLARLLPETSDEPPAEQDGGLVRLIVGDLRIERGRIAFTDQVPDPAFELPIGPVDVHLEGLSTLPDDRGRQRVVIETEGGARIAWEGTLQIQPLHSAGRLTASGPYVPVLYRYFQDQVTVQANQGSADLAFDYRFDLLDNGDISARVDDLDLAVRDVSIDQEGADILVVPELALEGAWLEYPERRAGATRYRISDPSVFLWRNPDGGLSVEQIAAAPATDSFTPDSAPAADREAPDDASPARLEDWELSLDEAVIENLALQFEDRTLQTPGLFEITDLDLAVSAISNAPGARFPVTLELALAPGGAIALDGEVGVLPAVTLDAVLGVTELQLAAIQPYVSEVVNVDIEDGLISTRSELTVREGEPFGASGDLRFATLSVADDQQGERLIGWQQIAVDRYVFSTAQNQLEVSDVLIGAPYVRLLIAEDQTTNFQQLLVESPVEDPELLEEDAAAPAEEDGATAAAEPLAITVGRVRVESGSADFTDLGLPLPFRAKIAELNGTVGTLDTTSQEPSEVRLEGQVADYGLARIEGSLLPLDPEQNTDLTVLFRNVELPDLTPYTIRFAGREIADGRMDLDLRYRVQEGTMAGSNSLMINDLQLGDRVEHPDAFNLPLGLAVALLKGPDGTIDVDVPVEGDVNDPEFRIGGVIVKAIVNLVTNIATSPFRLLGSLVGMEGDEEFDKLEFEPGRAELTPPERGKLTKLAEALNLRPQLTLKIPPVWDPEIDADALRVLQTDARIESLLADTQAGDDEQMFAARRRDAVEMLFQGDFPDVDLEDVRAQFRTPVDPEQPEGESTLDQTAYIAELRDRLVAASGVSDAALEALAFGRATAVVSALTEAAEIDAARLRIEDPREADVTEDGWVQMTLEVDAGEGA